ncbi:MAG: hypothetical protein KAI35_02130 [Desulfobulbaceae bacterium]|nr:hypothetical protein [Desulfobulbaceae bacterium]
MKLTVLGSGGCMVIPKPLCTCRVCQEAREKGPPFERTGPSVFLSNENLLIDTPAEISSQLNRERIKNIDYLMFTHLDPDHVEGIRVVEQITLDFRTWRAYPDKQIRLVLPETLMHRLKNISSAYGPLLDYYEEQGFIKSIPFRDKTKIGKIHITALPVDRGDQVSFIYVFEKNGRKIVYAPCDIKPFPEHRDEVLHADLIIIQPGIFENRLKHDFIYPDDHVSRTTLYTFDETIDLCKRIQAARILFVHIEEYWNRGHNEYCELQKKYDNISFAYDGMRVTV